MQALITKRESRMIVALVVASGLMSGMPPLAIPLLPVLPSILGASVDSVSWIATIALVTGAVANGVAGRLGELYGRRRVIAASVLLAFAGSVLGWFSHSLGPLIVARGLQGAGIGVGNVALGVIRDEVPEERVAQISAYLGFATILLSVGLLPLVMSAMVSSVDWHAVFWGGAVLTVICFAAVTAFVPARPPAERAPFDWLGAFGLALFLALFLLPISRAASWGWASPGTIGMLCAAAAVATAWVWWQRRAISPVVDLAIAFRRPVLMCHGLSAIAGFLVWAQIVVTYTVVRQSTGFGLGRSVTVAALTQLPGVVLVTVCAPVAANWIQTRGASGAVRFSCWVMGVGFGAGLIWHASIVQITMTSTVVFGGIGFLFGAMQALLTERVEPSETAQANAVNLLTRTVGSACATATFGMVLASFATTVDGVAQPRHLAVQLLYGLSALVALTGVVVTRH